MKIAISSGHGKQIPGAVGYIKEVENARLVVEKVAEYLIALGVPTETFHDNVSDDQSENLHRIVDWHNAQARDLDVSIHFNAFEPTETEPMGCECLFVSQETLAENLASAMSHAGKLKNRGAKYRSDLFFLNSTDEPAVLLEVCFVDSLPDVTAYQENLDELCRAIANTLVGE